MKSDFVDKDTLSEAASRKNLLADCLKRFGPEGVRQLKLLFAKWDKLIANCKNESESKHMKAMACAEIYNVMGYSGGITMGGQVIIPDDRPIPEPKNNA